MINIIYHFILENKDLPESEFSDKLIKFLLIILDSGVSQKKLYDETQDALEQLMQNKEVVYNDTIYDYYYRIIGHLLDLLFYNKLKTR